MIAHWMIKDAIYTSLSNSKITFKRPNEIRKKDPLEFENASYRIEVCLSEARYETLLVKG